MRIHTIEIKNFKGFEQEFFTFSPQMTVLVGDNGSGKTSVLDALSFALGTFFLWSMEDGFATFFFAATSCFGLDFTAFLTTFSSAGSASLVSLATTGGFSGAFLTGFGFSSFFLS